MNTAKHHNQNLKNTWNFHRFHVIITYLNLQTNALGNIYVGLWWSVKTDLNFTLSTILDWTWFGISFACPLLQSIYLTCKDRKKGEYRTHILNITIRDNRKAN